MCMVIDPTIKSLNKRFVWKIFDKQNRKIISLYQAASYPLGKRIFRSKGPTINDWGYGTNGLHFFLSKTIAKKYASRWGDSYIAKFKVDPKDFLFASHCGEEAMYESATRVGKYISIGNKP